MSLMICASLGAIDWAASPSIMRAGDYVERWRIALWVEAFIPFFKGEVQFTKFSKLLELPNGVDAVQRILFKCNPSPCFLDKFI